eukprot:SAG25_NODE_6418_length_561_cov_1.017316_1_plen_28_part_01
MHGCMAGMAMAAPADAFLAACTAPHPAP